jgi:hypothetical protein
MDITGSNLTPRPEIAAHLEQATLFSDLFIGARVAPPVAVERSSGFYPRFDINQANLLRDEVKSRAPGSSSARIHRQHTLDTYNTQQFSIEAVIPDETALELGVFNLDLAQKEAEFAQRQVLLAHERRVATKAFAPATFAVITSGTAYTLANIGSTGFDVGLDVDLAKAEIRKRGERSDAAALIAVMSEDVFIRARASERLIRRIRGSAVASDTTLILSESELAAALGVREVLVGRASFDITKQKAAASSLSSIWSNTYLWVGHAGAPNAANGSFLNGSALATLFWRQDTGGIIAAESYREESIKSEVVRARQNTDEKVIDANRGQLIVTQYS